MRKCPYCDFNSHENKQNHFPENQYVDALIRDLEFELPRIWGRTINTVFIGGGTPSLFSVDAMRTLMQALTSRLNLHPDIEITLEANPGTVEAGKFKGYREAGINRLSIGVQSFNDEKLSALGRIHDADEARVAIQIAQDAGFDNFNIDIMFGLPEQNIDQAMDDLQTAIAHKPTHISWYQLTMEPNTVFYSKPPRLPDDDSIWEMQLQGQKLLGDAGYKQYEVSAYAKQPCQHNLNYWQFGDYLGIGAGAHGKITDASRNVVERSARVKLPESYMQKTGSEKAYASHASIDEGDMIFEFMLNALRLTDGFDTNLFSQRTGIPLEHINNILEDAKQQDLLDWQSDWIKPTEKGSRYLNNLMQLFLP